MPLHPAIAEKLHLIDGLRPEDLADPVLLGRFVAFMGDPATWEPAPVEVDDRTVPGPHGEIPVRVYRGAADTSTALLWAHGGGFQAGNLEMPEAHVVATELAARASATVVSVDYRLATGGVHYPVPLDDVRAAWRWMGTELGARRCAIGGASAGAALALAAAINARDEGERRPDAVLLAYPFAHFPCPPLDEVTAEEMRALPRMLRFSAADMEGMVAGYVGRISDLPADALPGAARLHDLPPVHVVLCEYDDLRPSGELLVRQLRESGVEVEALLAPGVPHGHLNRFPEVGPVAESLDFLADALRAKIPS
jgi:acetyl esterase/lipase